MYTALGGQFVLEQGVDHTMPRRLHLALERLGCDNEAEVSLGGSIARHGRMVCMEMRVVVDL